MADGVICAEPNGGREPKKKRPAFGAGRIIRQGRGSIMFGDKILPENLSDCKPKVTAFGEGGALPGVCAVP